MADEESGIDELMRLSQQFTRQEKDREEKERQRAEQGKKVKDVLQGLRELNLSMAIEQLKPVAPPAIIEEVNALKNKTGTEDLRRTISDLTEELEKHIEAASASNPEIAQLVNSVKTLNILLDLYFSF